MIRFCAVEEIALCNCKANGTEYELENAKNIRKTTWLFARWLIMDSNSILAMQRGLQKHQIYD